MMNSAWQGLLLSLYAQVARGTLFVADGHVGHCWDPWVKSETCAEGSSQSIKCHYLFPFYFLYSRSLSDLACKAFNCSDSVVISDFCYFALS